MEQITTVVQGFRDHHKKLKGLFEQLEAAPARASEMTPGVVRELCMELDINFQLKEKYLYPKLMTLLSDVSEQAIIRDRLGDIEQCKKLLSEIFESNQKRVPQKSKLSELTVQTVELFDREEKEIFPKAQSFSEIEDLSEQFSQERQKISSLPKYKDSHAEEVQNPQGGEQKRIAS